MIFSDFVKALGQMTDPRFRRVLFLGLGLTIALLFAVYAVFLGVIHVMTPDTVELPIVGPVDWVDDLLSWGSIALMILMSIFLMIPVASAFTSLFLEDVSRAVEDRHYPHLQKVPRVKFLDGLVETLNFLGLLVMANAVAFVAYLLFLPAAVFIFWALNGYLLGREYYQLVAMRRLGRAGAKQAYRQNRGQIWLAGILMAMPLTVPLLNLIVPILGAATFTHLFHRLNPRAPSG